MEHRRGGDWVQYRDVSYQAQLIVNKVILEEISMAELENALCNEEYAVDHPAIREALAYLESLQ